jgi:hypothetical protein
MLGRSISYDEFIQLIRGRLQGDRSRERARDVLKAALVSGEIPMEPVIVPLEAKRYGYHSAVAWLDRNYPAAPRRKEAASQPKRRRKPTVDPLIEVLKELYPPHGDVPDTPFKSDTQILGQIETRRPQLADTFSPDSVNRARKLTREAALAAPKK